MALKPYFQHFVGLGQGLLSVSLPRSVPVFLGEVGGERHLFYVLPSERLSRLIAVGGALLLDYARFTLHGRLDSAKRKSSHENVQRTVFDFET